MSIASGRANARSVSPHPAAAIFTFLTAALLAGCGETERASLADRLQGNWGCLRTIVEEEFLRTDRASLEVNRTSIKYAYDSYWVCDTLANDAKGISRTACEAAAPSGRSGYFEGVFTAFGDSLRLRDGKDTLSFRKVTGRTLEFGVNGLVYPLTRN